jgi:hypothetical protein
MKILTFVLGLLLAGVLVSGSNAGTAVGTLQGTVIDSRGRAIAGATVTIQTSDGRHPHASHTDAAGQFSFSRFAVGQYDLRAYSRGSYSDWAKRISIGPHKPTQITLRIVAAKPSLVHLPFLDGVLKPPYPENISFELSFHSDARLTISDAGWELQNAGTTVSEKRSRAVSQTRPSLLRKFPALPSPGQTQA